MQKRARILDNKNMKRLHINRRGRSDINQNGNSTLFYVRMLVTWLSMVGLDAMTGFRFELLWPTWLMIRAAVESIQMRNQHCVTTIANPTAARFSVLFVCVTATSDLICYLFIPIRLLVFLATTLVWINLYCHTQGGVLRTVATFYGGERSQSWSIIIISCFIISFELFLRIRSHPILISIFPNVAEWAGVSPVWPRSLNAFFAAHSIGYPVILVTVSLHYYLNEWKLRRKQGDVANRNEQLFRILVESIPAEYDGPKDYTLQHGLEENGEMYYIDTVSSLQPMQAIQAAPPMSSTPPSKKNGIHRRSGETSSTSVVSSKKRKNGNALSLTPPNDKKKGKMIRNDADLDDVDDSDADDYSWRDQEHSEQQQRGGGIWIIRFIFDAASWAFCVLFKSSSSSPHKAASQVVEEEEDDEDGEYEKKNGRTDSLTNSANTKSRTNTMTSTTRSQNNNNNQSHQKQQQKQSANGKLHSHQKASGHANGHARSTGSASIRDSSHDTNASNDTDRRSLTRELEGLRAELSSRRSLEEDFKLQVSILESHETRLAQQISSMKMKVEQMEIKCSTLEKHRESDKAQLEQAERKYVDLLGKKADVEATLMSERKERIESANKKYDVAEHQRERERQLEHEIEKLRVELKSRDETNIRMESELHILRNYKEEHDIEAMTLELRFVREKAHQMEESLAGENKLKQSLFKCLGDARDTIRSLEHRIVDLQSKNDPAVIGSEALLNGHSSTEANNENDTSASDQSSPHQHSTMASPIPFSKIPLSVNVMNRGGSPFNEKMSPIGSMRTVMPTGNVPAPPDYMMAVGGTVSLAPQKQSVVGFPGIRYNEFKHMPTGGEHRLFDSPANSMSSPSPNGANSEDFLPNKGKFGAPSQPAARLA